MNPDELDQELLEEIERTDAQHPGFDLDEACTCDEPEPAIVGWSSRWVGPIVCARCRRVIEKAKP